MHSKQMIQFPSSKYLRGVVAFFKLTGPSYNKPLCRRKKVGLHRLLPSKISKVGEGEQGSLGGANPVFYNKKVIFVSARNNNRMNRLTYTMLNEYLLLAYV